MMEHFQAPPVFIEITPISLKALRDNSGIELPLERAADGKLTGASHKQTVAALQDFAGRKSWQLRVRAICAISVHGVSLRKISLPPATGDELERVLRLQIENEFPLSPEELAWGWREISRDSTKLEARVVAVRKQTIQYYDSILSAAGLDPEFTVAALARETLCPKSGEPHVILEMGHNYYELASFQNNLPTGLNILPAGGDIVGSVLKSSCATTIYLSGTKALPTDILEGLSRKADCRRLEVSAGPGSSAATQGLQKTISLGLPWLRLQTKSSQSIAKFSLPRLDFTEVEARRWLVRGAALLAVLLILPFAESLLLKPLLARRLESLKSEQQKFTSLVEPEMEFLQSLKQSQPPYLDALYVFSEAAPPGSQLESLTMNQQGAIQLKASLQSAQQVMEFRSKLIASRFFANLTVEDQSPVMNQPKISVRMTAQWKPDSERAGVKIGPSPGETGNANAAGDAARQPGLPPIPKS